MRFIPILSLSIFVTLFSNTEKFGFHYLHYIFLNLISALYRIIVSPLPWFSALPEYLSHPIQAPNLRVGHSHYLLEHLSNPCCAPWSPTTLFRLWHSEYSCAHFNSSPLCPIHLALPYLLSFSLNYPGWEKDHYTLWLFYLCSRA